MRRFKKLLLGLGVLLLVLALAAGIAEWSFHRSGSRKLAETTAGLDAAEPGWRIPDLEAARRAAQPPAESNSAVVVLELHDRIPKTWSALRASEDALTGYPTNHTPAFWQLVWLHLGRDETAALRSTARDRLLKPELLAKPGGYYPIEIAEVPFATLLPHAQKVRELAGVLGYDANLAALEGQPDRGLRAARAELLIARSIGDEPFLISQLIRMACARMAMQSALQVLAWRKPKEGLAELQQELLAEAEFNGLLAGLRGERGIVDATFEGLRSGKFPLNKLGGDTDAGGGPGGAISFQLYRGLLPGDQAKSLELLTAAVRAAQLPPHERLAALNAIPIPPGPPDEFRYLMTRLLVPAWLKVADAGIRNRADLLSASVAIACERYRLANKRWPDSLEAIPKSILPEIPTDRLCDAGSSCNAE